MAGAVAPVDIDVTVKGLSEVEKLSKRMMALEKEITRLQGKLPKAANAIAATGRAAKGAGDGVKNLKDSIAGIVVKLAAASVAAYGFQQSLGAAFERGNTEKRLQNLTGSTAEYEQALRLAKLAANDFGLTQTEATKALGDTYSRLQGVGYGLTEVNEVYRGFNVVAKEAGVSADDANGAFLQLSQGLGAGVLNGENLATILERMPQLAQLLATEAGVAAGAVKQAGADGKITGDVIYAALSKAAGSAVDFSGKLTEQQATMNQVKQRAEELQVALGNALAPTFLAALNKLAGIATIVAGAFQAMNKFAIENEASIAKVVAVGGEVGKIAAAIFIVIKAYQAWQLAVAGVAAAKATLIALTGKGIPLVLAAAAAGTAVYAGLSVAAGKTNKEIELMQANIGKEIEGIREQAKAGEETYRGLNKEINNQVESLEKVTKEIQSQTLALQTQQAAADNNTKLTQARFAAEEAINGVLLDQANQRLNNAKTAAEQLKAAQDIYNLTLQQAEIEYQSTLAAIEGMVQKAEMQAKAVQLKFKELEATVALAQAEGTITEEHKKALEAQGQAIKMSTEMLKTTRAVAVEQRKGAEAIFSGAQSTAKAAFEQNKVWQATTNAANAAGVFAQNMGSAASQAASVASSMEKAAAASGSMKGSSFSVDGAAAYAAQYSDAPTGTGPKRQTFGELMSASSKYQSVINNAKVALKENSWATTAYTQAAEYASIGYNKAAALLTRYADSLYSQPGPNTGKQKVQAAMEQYRQASNPNQVAQQVNIQTGPVTQMDGTNYVTTSDLQNATASAAQQGANLALSQLQNDPGVRRAVGVSR